MPDNLPLLVFLAVISACLLMITAALLLATKDLHQIFRQLQRVLPMCQGALHDVQRTLRDAHELLHRANHGTRVLETVAHRASHAVVDAVDRLTTRAQAFFQPRARNGARVGPRRHVRHH